MLKWNRKRDEPEPAMHSSARPTGRRLLGGVFAIVIATALTVLLWPDGTPVELELVERGPLQVVVREDGRTRVRDRYVVSAPVTATLMRVALEPGDPVKAGEPMIEFVPAASPLSDPTTQAQARARVTAAEAALERAKGQAVQAEAAVAIAAQNTRRQEILLEQTSGSPAALERAQLEQRIREQDLSSAQFGIRIAEEELAMARMAVRPVLGDGRQRVAASPVDGVVLRVFNEGGGLVQAGTPILEIGDPSALEAVIDVLTSDATRVEVGCAVVLDRWGGPPLQGRVQRVEPSAFTRVSALGVEEQRVNIVVDLTAPPSEWSELGDGYRVEAGIVVWEDPDVVQVPINALFQHMDGWAVFVREAGRAVLRPVTIGEWGDRTAEVLAGLDEGEQVVAYPSDAISDGLRIRP